MIVGVVLAAGRSSRMGKPKLALPWRDGRTVIGSVVEALRRGGVDRVVVVVGADREAVEGALVGEGVHFVAVPDPEGGEMLASVQVGLAALDDQASAAMLVPGDLPAIRPETVAALRLASEAEPDRLLAPVHAGRRGHPVVVPRRSWGEIASLGPDQSLRTFLRRHQAHLRPIEVDDPGIRTDLDTPDDYRRWRPAPD